MTSSWNLRGSGVSRAGQPLVELMWASEVSDLWRIWIHGLKEVPTRFRLRSAEDEGASYEVELETGAIADAARAAMAGAQAGVVSGVSYPELDPVRRGERLLRKGAEGEIASALQRALNEAEAGPLEESGRFEASTRRAVRRFQAGQNLAIDGVVGPVTLGALDRSLGNETQSPASPPVQWADLPSSPGVYSHQGGLIVAFPGVQSESRYMLEATTASTFDADSNRVLVFPSKQPGGGTNSHPVTPPAATTPVTPAGAIEGPFLLADAAFSNPWGVAAHCLVEAREVLGMEDSGPILSSEATYLYTNGKGELRRTSREQLIAACEDGHPDLSFGTDFEPQVLFEQLDRADLLDAALAPNAVPGPGYLMEDVIYALRMEWAIPFLITTPKGGAYRERNAVYPFEVAASRIQGSPASLPDPGTSYMLFMSEKQPGPKEYWIKEIPEDQLASTLSDPDLFTFAGAVPSRLRLPERGGMLHLVHVLEQGEAVRDALASAIVGATRPIQQLAGKIQFLRQTYSLAQFSAESQGDEEAELGRKGTEHCDALTAELTGGILDDRLESAYEALRPQIEAYLESLRSFPEAHWQACHAHWGYQLLAFLIPLDVLSVVPPSFGVEELVDDALTGIDLNAPWTPLEGVDGAADDPLLIDASSEPALGFMSALRAGGRGAYATIQLNKLMTLQFAAPINLEPLSKLLEARPTRDLEKLAKLERSYKTTARAAGLSPATVKDSWATAQNSASRWRQDWRPKLEAELEAASEGHKAITNKALVVLAVVATISYLVRLAEENDGLEDLDWKDAVEGLGVLGAVSRAAVAMRGSVTAARALGAVAGLAVLTVDAAALVEAEHTEDRVAAGIRVVADVLAIASLASGPVGVVTGLLAVGLHVLAEIYAGWTAPSEMESYALAMVEDLRGSSFGLSSEHLDALETLGGDNTVWHMRFPVRFWKMLGQSEGRARWVPREHELSVDRVQLTPDRLRISLRGWTDDSSKLVVRYSDADDGWQPDDQLVSESGQREWVFNLAFGRKLARETWILGRVLGHDGGAHPYDEDPEKWANTVAAMKKRKPRGVWVDQEVRDLLISVPADLRESALGDGDEHTYELYPRIYLRRTYSLGGTSHEVDVLIYRARFYVSYARPTD